jgi:hypothetical protein
MFGLGALGQLALGQAPFTVVQADAAAPVEYAGNFLSDLTIREEAVVSASIDWRVNSEMLTTADRSDSAINAESFELLRVNWAAVLEYQDTQNADASSRIEIGEALRSDADAGVQLEVFESFRRDAAPLIEVTPSVAADTASPLESLSGVPTVSTDGAVPLEITPASRVDSNAPVETVGAVLTGDADVSLEVTPSSATRNSAIQVESSSLLRDDDGSPRIEVLSHQLYDARPSFEFQATLLHDTSLSLELTEPTVSSESSAPIELLGNAAVVADGNVNLESLFSASQDWITWIDTLGTVTMALSDSAIQFEILQSASYSDSALVLEILQWAQLKQNRNELWSEEWSGLDTIGGI